MGPKRRISERWKGWGGGEETSYPYHWSATKLLGREEGVKWPLSTGPISLGSSFRAVNKVRAAPKVPTLYTCIVTIPRQSFVLSVRTRVASVEVRLFNSSLRLPLGSSLFFYPHPTPLFFLPLFNVLLILHFGNHKFKLVGSYHECVSHLLCITRDIVFYNVHVARLTIARNY